MLGVEAEVSCGELNTKCQRNTEGCYRCKTAVRGDESENDGKEGMKIWSRDGDVDNIE